MDQKLFYSENQINSLNEIGIDYYISNLSSYYHIISEQKNRSNRILVLAPVSNSLLKDTDNFLNYKTMAQKLFSVLDAQSLIQIKTQSKKLNLENNDLLDSKKILLKYSEQTEIIILGDCKNFLPIRLHKQIILNTLDLESVCKQTQLKQQVWQDVRRYQFQKTGH